MAPADSASTPVPSTQYVNPEMGQVWYENGSYVGSTPPGAFKPGEKLTQQLIRQRIREVGFQDPAFAGSERPVVATATATAQSLAGRLAGNVKTYRWG